MSLELLAFSIQHSLATVSPALESPDDHVIIVKEISEILPGADSYGDQGVLWGDFDLMYMGHGRNPTLYQQTDGKFVNVVTEAGIKIGDRVYSQQADRHGASCADYDKDGNQDLCIGQARWLARHWK